MGPCVVFIPDTMATLLWPPYTRTGAAKGKGGQLLVPTSCFGASSVAYAPCGLSVKDKGPQALCPLLYALPHSSSPDLLFFLRCCIFKRKYTNPENLRRSMIS